MASNNIMEILFVEDNPHDMGLPLHAFKKNKLMIQIEVVRDGAQAREFIFSTGAYAQRNVENGSNVILLDLKSPKVSGLDVLQRIKADPRTKDIPVMVLTSSREEWDIIESYQLGPTA